MKILFWNLYKKDLRSLVCKAAKELSIDVVALVESGVPPAEMLSSLKANASPNYHVPVATTGRFQLFCRDKTFGLDEIYSGRRISVRQSSIAGNELLLGFVHLIDKDNFGPMSQLTQTTLLVDEIKRLEEKRGHSRTILIGDFNMNPFDEVMNQAAGMNAMMSAKCVEPGSRTVQEIAYGYFYNPMWSLLGDRTPGLPGTFYHSNSGKGHFGWNTPDQVLLRPSAISLFNEVHILTEFGNSTLTSRNGRPNKNAVSDHFPLLVTLN